MREIYTHARHSEDIYGLALNIIYELHELKKL